MNKSQMELLIALITDIAEEVVSDSTSRDSDYAGIGLIRIRQNAEKLANEFNEAL